MRDSRTVLLGENGTGKTTLIRLILEGNLVRIVPKAKIGYLRQDLSDLDEPTNYLDIPSIEAVQTLLSEYEGTMLFTSHDRTFVRAIATDAVVIREKRIMPAEIGSGEAWQG